jgi:hypothetical protein
MRGFLELLCIADPGGDLGRITLPNGYVPVQAWGPPGALRKGWWSGRSLTCMQYAAIVLCIAHFNAICFCGLGFRSVWISN